MAQFNLPIRSAPEELVLHPVATTRTEPPADAPARQSMARRQLASVSINESQSRNSVMGLTKAEKSAVEQASLKLQLDWFAAPAALAEPFNARHFVDALMHRIEQLSDIQSTRLTQIRAFCLSNYKTEASLYFESSERGMVLPREAKKSELNSTKTYMRAPNSASVVVIDNQDKKRTLVEAEGHVPGIYIGQSFDTKSSEDVGTCVAKVMPLNEGEKWAQRHKNDMKMFQVTPSTQHFSAIKGAIQTSTQAIVFEEYARNGDAFDLIDILSAGESAHKLTQQQLIDVLTYLVFHMLSAVGEMHQKNMSHRDLKPDNFLIGERSLQLTDFAATTQQVVDDPRASLFGDPVFTDRERTGFHGGQKLSAHFDLYSLGISFTYLSANTVLDNLTPDGENRAVKTFVERLDALATSLTDKDETKRISCEEALKNPIFNSVVSHEQFLALNSLIKNPE